MQSDTSFILDSYLSIGACVCDVSTWTNITGSLIESQHLSREKSSLLHKGVKQRIRYSLPVCRSSQHVSLSLSVGLSASLSPHGTSRRQQHPATARFASREARSALIRPQHATASTVVLFTGHFSWLLKSLAFSCLPFLWGHRHQLRVNSHSRTLRVFFHPPFLCSFSFSTFVLLQCGAAVYTEMDRRMGLRGADGVEGKGRGRLPEGSALWLALSNWLMRKASLCSWQAGDSSSWLRWYTYLGLKCLWRWWREGLPSHCKGVKKEIRLLHIMPNEIGHRLMHMLQCHTNACTRSLVLLNTHPWRGWVIESLEERSGSTCWKSMFSVSLTLKFERSTASLAKWKTTKMWEKKWMLQGGSCSDDWCSTSETSYCSSPGPLQVHFFAHFSGMTQRSLSIIEWITKHWKHFSLVSAVDKCCMRSGGHIGNSVEVNLWYPPVLEINQAYSIYPTPNLSMWVREQHMSV